MAQKIIVIINAETGEDILPEEVQNHLNDLGYQVEMAEDTLQKATHPFQPLAYALQDDVTIALENGGYDEPSDKLVDIASRNLTGNEDFQEQISDAAANVVAEGFDDEDLEEEDDDDDE